MLKASDIQHCLFKYKNQQINIIKSWVVPDTKCQSFLSGNDKTPKAKLYF